MTFTIYLTFRLRNRNCVYRKMKESGCPKTMRPCANHLPD